MADDPDRMLRVLRGLIRPLVRTLIARGVTAPAFYRMLKSVYVEVAHEQFRLTDAPPTDSRVSLLTGVHRRDVRAILSDPDDAWPIARAKSAAFATVLARWQTDNATTGDDGAPRALSRAEFEALVSSVSRDIRPRTVLDELMRQDLVSEAEDGTLTLTDAARAGPADADDRLVFFAANVGDHLAAATENLLAEEPRFLERAVFYNRLTPSDVDAIEAEARTLSQTVLETLNSESARRQQANRDAPDNDERYRFGVYFYRERPRPPKEDPSDPD